nr:hypothetical protein [Tanacetum cinerariifolium]
IDTTVIPTKTPIIAHTIPPSPDYTPASPDYSPASDTESDPSEDPSSGHIPPLLAISPFLSSNDDTTNSDTPNTHHHLPMVHLSLRLPLLMTSVPASPPVSEAFSHVRADLIPSPKRVRDSGYLADVEVGHRETSLRDDVISRDALRERGIDARVVVEAVDQDEIETGVRGPIEVIEGVQREQGHRIVGVELAVTALTERVAELEKDNRRLKGTTSVEIAFSDDLSDRNSYFLYFEHYLIASMTREEVEELVARRVAKEMEAREATRNLETLNENGNEQEGENGGNGNGENGGNGNGGNGGNGNGWNGENGNHGMNYGGFMPMA